MGALMAAKEHRIPTGGLAPKGLLIENGRNLNLCVAYKFNESDSPKYEKGILKNIETTYASILFLNESSRGSDLALRLCAENNKPILMISTKNFNEKGFIKII